MQSILNAKTHPANVKQANFINKSNTHEKKIYTISYCGIEHIYEILVGRKRKPLQCFAKIDDEKIHQ